MSKKNQITTDSSVAPQLRKLEIFDKLSFPITRQRYIKVAVQDIQNESNLVKKFSTRIDRSSGQIFVIRTK